MNKVLKTITIAISISLIIIPTQYVSAINDFYSTNDILFYNGSDNNCINSTSDTLQNTNLTGYDRLKEAVRVFGEQAMEMERTYGAPWEVILAQMQMESQVGIAGHAIEGADNNWLGIKGEGDAGSWISSGDVAWAKYSSVSVSVTDWAGPRVLRNGIYDKAFSYLDPNNYNLDSFLTEMLSHYAPNSDNNNENVYKQNVLSFIEGPIKEVRAEKNWPSSSELAKKENIIIGGKYAIGSKVDPINYNSISCSSSGNGNINKTAINLAWADRTHIKEDPKPEYASALKSVGLTTYGDQWVQIGASCDAFVATVMRYSGVDKDFACCGTSNMLNNYLSKSSKYQEIPNLGNTSNLQPGDIFIIDGHIMLYIKLDDGSEKIASASYGDRTADYASGVYYSDERGTYHIYRYKG